MHVLSKVLASSGGGRERWLLEVLSLNGDLPVRFNIFLCLCLVGGYGSVALVQGLLCVGLADERLRSNALLGATPVLDGNMLSFGGVNPGGSAAMQNTVARLEEERWSLAFLGLGILECGYPWDKVFFPHSGRSDTVHAPQAMAQL